MSTKKAQSAFELITTYGWVFMTIIAIASTLAFLNFTNPAIFLDEECISNTEFSCLDYGLSENSTGSSAIFVFRNRLPEPVRDRSKIACYFKDYIAESPFPRDIEAGETFEIGCSGPKQNWTAGSKRKINFKIVYYTNISSRGIPQVSNGHLYAEVK